MYSHQLIKYQTRKLAYFTVRAQLIVAQSSSPCKSSSRHQGNAISPSSTVLICNTVSYLPPSEYSSTMFFSATLLALAGIARFVAAQSNGTAYPYMVAPGEFNQVDKNNDCLAQRNSCRQICGGIAPVNNCDAVSTVPTSHSLLACPPQIHLLIYYCLPGLPPMDMHLQRRFKPQHYQLPTNNSILHVPPISRRLCQEHQRCNCATSLQYDPLRNPASPKRCRRRRW